LALASGVQNVYDRHMDRSQYCAHCVATMLSGGDYHTVLNSDDSPVIVNRNVRTYLWDDGTERLNEPPPVIGSYHSSKQYVGPLPNLDGTPFNGVTLGLELEMECVPNPVSRMGREGMARKLMGRVKAARPAAWNDRASRAPGYAFCENDSSIGNGFEMVTSWGSLDVHREMILKVFSPEDDSADHAFAGLLRSNDAESSCGLHVHVVKPKSLSHAARLQAFYHDVGNRKLVRAVARRYAVHYAKVCAGKDKESVDRNTKNALGGYGQYLNKKSGSPFSETNREQIIARSISRLGDGDRYQQVNFCNDATIEIRVYKGSMLPTTIIACLEFTHAVWMFTRDARAIDLTTAKFMEFINRADNRRETEFLRGYLAQKGFICYQPRPHKEAKEYRTETTAEEA
jgi:hypothetical protein